MKSLRQCDGHLVKIFAKGNDVLILAHSLTAKTTVKSSFEVAPTILVQITRQETNWLADTYSKF